jgi:cyanophycinase
MTVLLVGGAVDSTRSGSVLEPFRSAVRARRGRVVLVLVDREGSAARVLPSYVEALGGDGVDIHPILIRDDEPVDPDVFTGASGIAIAGGPTPSYHAGLIGCADAIRGAVDRGAPYVGFSAGAMIGPDLALLGGHRLGDVEVVHEDCSEGLEPLTVVPGLGLARFAVDVHAAQAGTLSRAVALVEAGLVPEAVAIDEDTCVAVGVDVTVRGSGSAWFITPSQYGVRITRRTS